MFSFQVFGKMATTFDCVLDISPLNHRELLFTSLSSILLLNTIIIVKLIAWKWCWRIKIIDHAGKLKSREIDHKLCEVISMAIIEHGLPFSFVEYKWIRELHSMLNPDMKHYSRNTVVADVWKFHKEQKEKLKQSMHRCRNRICLTSDS